MPRAALTVLGPTVARTTRRLHLSSPGRRRTAGVTAVAAMIGASVLAAGPALADLTAGPATGTVAGWGDDRYGQLDLPAALGGVGVNAVAAGLQHSLALAGGRVFAWGSDSLGQTDVPASLSSTAATVTAVAAGGFHSLALSGGHVTAWGYDGYGQTEVPASLATAQVTAIAAGQFQSLALAGGQVTAWGGDTSGQTDVPPALKTETTTAIAGGGQHSLALASDGTVTAWGSDLYGQTDIPASLTGATVTAIAAGDAHSLALTSDGRVVGWGSDRFGQIDVPASLTGKKVSAIAAGANHSVALTSDGQVVAWGYDTQGQATVPPTVTATTTSAIAAGGNHSLAVVSAPLVVVTSPLSQTVPAGSAATFTAAATGVDEPSVQWQRASAADPATFVDIPGATDTTYTTGPVATADDGARFRAVFTDGGAVVTSGVATLSVTAPPAAPSILSVSRDDGRLSVVFAPGDPGLPAPTTYTATATPVDPTAGGPVNSPVSTGSPIVVTGLTDGVGYTVTVTASNPTGSATSAASTPVTVGVAPGILGAPPVGTVGTSYSFAYALSGAPAPSAAVTAGTLPAGLTLSPEGVLSGTPTQAGTFAFTVTATSAVGTASVNSTVVVAAAPVKADITLALTAPASVGAGTPYPVTVTVSNAGPGTATRVNLAVVLPASVRLLSTSDATPGTAGSTSQVAGVVTWTIPKVAAGTPVTRTLTVVADTPGPVSFAGLAFSRAVTDPNRADNSVSVDTTVTP